MRNRFESRIKAIEERNKRVELDKTWETSWTRRVVILVLTYIVAAVFFYSARVPDPFLNAVWPSVAFVLSTLTLPWFKKVWMRRR